MIYRSASFHCVKMEIVRHPVANHPLIGVDPFAAHGRSVVALVTSLKYTDFSICFWKDSCTKASFGRLRHSSLAATSALRPEVSIWRLPSCVCPMMFWSTLVDYIHKCSNAFKWKIHRFDSVWPA